MPKMTKADGQILTDPVIIERIWMEIPMKDNPIDFHHVLVNPIVADYIEYLEEQVKSLTK